MLRFYLLMNLSSVSFRARLALCSRISVSERRDTQALGPSAPTWPLILCHAGSFLPELSRYLYTLPRDSRGATLQLILHRVGNGDSEGKCCTVGVRLSCHQTQTEAVPFMVFLHHPVFQATGSNVLLSKVPLR